MTALSFQTTQFNVIDRNSQPWLRLHQIGEALGYSRPDAVNKIYQSNADEFTDSMTALVELDTEGGKQQVRIFSLRGCHLLAMLSRTKIAKDFRKWALDILDHHKAQEEPTLEYKTDDLPPDVLNAVNSRAMALCLRHYEHNKIQLREAIKKWGNALEGKKLVEFVQTIEQPDTRLVIVHRNELWKLTSRLAALEVIQQQTMGAIHSLEDSTGMEWYGR